MISHNIMSLVNNYENILSVVPPDIPIYLGSFWRSFVLSRKVQSISSRTTMVSFGALFNKCRNRESSIWWSAMLIRDMEYFNSPARAVTRAVLPEPGVP